MRVRVESREFRVESEIDSSHASHEITCICHDKMCLQSSISEVIYKEFSFVVIYKLVMSSVNGHFYR